MVHCVCLKTICCAQRKIRSLVVVTTRKVFQGRTTGWKGDRSVEKVFIFAASKCKIYPFAGLHIILWIVTLGNWTYNLELQTLNHAAKILNLIWKIHYHGRLLDQPGPRIPKTQERSWVGNAFIWCAIAKTRVEVCNGVGLRVPLHRSYWQFESDSYRWAACMCLSHWRRSLGLGNSSRKASPPLHIHHDNGWSSSDIRESNRWRRIDVECLLSKTSLEWKYKTGISARTRPLAHSRMIIICKWFTSPARFL